jgi:hypothetical protein
MDSMNDALIALVKALGGSKVVGPMLWPEKMADAAQRVLLDCLNPERPAHLTPEQTALLLRKARQAGHHDALAWILADLGYAAPVPLAPRDEAADLQRQFIAATEQMATMMARMQALQADMAVTASPKLRAAA